MIMSISSYKTIVFDCDGVVLNSNAIKSEAFRIASQKWGAEASDALVSHHVQNGGISRHRKFNYFIDSILPFYKPSALPGIDGPDLDELLTNYAQAVRSGLMTCAVADKLKELRSKTPNATWCIVSGGDQSELREIFAQRNLDHMFDGGIYGSPTDKPEILLREIKKRNICTPAIFLGDSKYDFECAQALNLDFVFINGWTEVPDWEVFVSQKNIRSIPYVADVLNL